MHGLSLLTSLPATQASAPSNSPAQIPAAALPRHPVQPLPAAAEARVTAFLLPLGREQIPVWVFVPAALAHGTAALVLHLGDQGLQVFSPPGAPWGTGPLRLHLLDELGEAAWPSDGALVQRLWRRTISHSGDLHGLAFLERAGPAELALRERSPEVRARNWVRCVIEPLRC